MNSNQQNQNKLYQHTTKVQSFIGLSQDPSNVKKQIFVSNVGVTEIQRKPQVDQVQLSQDPCQKDAKTLQNSRWLVEWSPQQDDILFEKYVEFGSKWSDFIQYLPSKTDNSIKNRFYCCMRKVQRKLNKVQKEKKIKQRKLVKYQSLLTFLEISKSDFLSCDKRFKYANQNSNEMIEIRDSMIEIAKTAQKKIDDEKVRVLLLKFLDVKYSLKFINIQRVKSSLKSKRFDNERLSTIQQNTIAEQEQITSKSNGEQKQKNEEDTNIFDKYSLQNMIGDKKNEKAKKSLFEECQDILNIGSIKQQQHHLILF